MGVPKLWVNKVFDMQAVIWKSLLVELSAIESKNEQSDSRSECIGTTREASGFTS